MMLYICIYIYKHKIYVIQYIYLYAQNLGGACDVMVSIVGSESSANPGRGHCILA